MNSQVNTSWQVPLPLPAPGSGNLTGLLQALANQTAQTQAMLTALLGQSSQTQTQTLNAAGSHSSSPEALLKALMAEVQLTEQPLPAVTPQVNVKRQKVGGVSSPSSSSPGSSSCTSPTLIDSESRSAGLRSSFSYGDDGGGCGGNSVGGMGVNTPCVVGNGQGVLGRDIGSTGVQQAVRSLKRPYEQPKQYQQQQQHQTVAVPPLKQAVQFPATRSLLSGVSVVQSTSAASAAAANSTSTVASDASDRRRIQQVRAESGSDSRYGPYQLLVAAQPELNHRARYLTEGSRGAVKDRSQTGYPAVQLLGWSQPVELCVFAGSDTGGRPRPHGYYQVCRVAGRHGCCEAREVVQDGTRMLLIPLQPRDGAVISLDCIGILKLRNADVDYQQQKQQQPSYEHQHSSPKSARPSRATNGKRSSKVRLVFRVILPLSDGTRVTLQTATQAIECSQPTGQPEIHRLSTHESSARGGSDLFIIGRNFSKGARVLFREATARTPTGAPWEAEAVIEAELSATNHLVCRVPAFGCDSSHHSDDDYSNSSEQDDRGDAKRNLPLLTAPVRVLISVVCSDRTSEPVCFTYLPGCSVTESSYASAERQAAVALPDCHNNQLLQLPQHQPGMLDYLTSASQDHQHLENQLQQQQQQQRRQHQQLDFDAAFLTCPDADGSSSVAGPLGNW